MKEVRPLFSGNIIENFSDIPLCSTRNPHLVKLSPIYDAIRQRIRKILLEKGYETTHILLLSPDPEDRSKIQAYVRYSKEQFPEEWTWVDQMNWLKRRGFKKTYKFTYDELGFGFFTQFPDDFEDFCYFYHKEMYKEEFFLFARKIYKVDHDLEVQFEELPRNKWIKIDKNVIIPRLFLWGTHTVEGWIYIRHRT